MTTPDADAVAALAEAIHKSCEAGWERRAAHGAVAITMHGVDAHRETATIMVPALTSAGWTLVRRSEREALVATARDVWDHWVNGIGWFDGYDGTRPDKTAIHLTQMTVEDEQEMTRRMDVLAEALGIEERYYEGPGRAAIEAAAVARHVAAERGTPSAAETGCDELREALRRLIDAIETTGLHEHDDGRGGVDLCVPIAGIRSAMHVACAAAGHEFLRPGGVPPFCRWCGAALASPATEEAPR